MKKILSLFALLVAIVTGAMAQTVTTGDYTTRTISANNLSSTWAFNVVSGSAVNGSTSGQTDNEMVLVANSSNSNIKYQTSNYLTCKGGSSVYIPVPTGSAGTVSLVMSSSSDSRYFQLYVYNSGKTAEEAGTASQRLWSKYSETATSDGKKGPQSFAFTSADIITYNDNTYLHFIDNNAEMKVTSFTVTLTTGTYATKTVATQAFAGVKQGDNTLTENTDYTVDGTTITLTDAATFAPSDISLINHVTYTDESEEDTDVAVEFGETASEGYFSGSVTIGLTTYTVKVPQDVTPTLEASETALSVTSVKVGTGTATFTLTGANLAGESVSVAFASAVEGLTVSPASIEIASGAVNQEVTVSYQSNEDVDAAVVNLVVSTTGVSAITIPVTYSSTAPVIYSQVDVTEAATWNWANYGTNEIKLTDTTTPSKSTEFLLANIENYGYNAPASTFGNAQQLLMTTEYVVREGKYWQGGSIKFNTTVPGKITVVYSNTGNRDDEAQRRFLNVNGINYGVGTMTSKSTTTTTVSVAAGEVAITGKFGPSVEDQANQYLRINSITFTPTTTETVTIPTEGVATYVTKSALDFSSIDGTIKAYAVTNVGETSATTAEVGQVPAGTPLLIKGVAGEYDVEIVESADDIENLLKVSDGTIVGGDDIYAYSKTALKFKKVAATVKIPAGKAYLQATGGTTLDIDFEGEATAIGNVNANDNANFAPVKVLTAKGVQIGKFNVAGQQVK